jgi:hypothetical protein
VKPAGGGIHWRRRWRQLAVAGLALTLCACLSIALAAQPPQAPGPSGGGPQPPWQRLILDAYASPGPDSAQRRPDFSVDEIAEGRTLFFQQEDNVFGQAAYRMRIRSASTGRLVFDVENATTIRYLIMPLFEPGQAQSIYFLEQEAAGVWRYYSIARTSGKAGGLIARRGVMRYPRSTAQWPSTGAWRAFRRTRNLRRRGDYFATKPAMPQSVSFVIRPWPCGGPASLI